MQAWGTMRIWDEVAASFSANTNVSAPDYEATVGHVAAPPREVWLHVEAARYTMGDCSAESALKYFL